MKTFQNLKIITTEEEPILTESGTSIARIRSGIAMRKRDKLSIFLNSITDAYIALDREWRFLEVNPVAESEIFNRPADELVGEVFWDLYPGGRDGVFHKQYEEAFRQQVPIHFEAKSHIRDVWLEVYACPNKERLDVYFRNITERKQIEMALRASEERFRQLADSMPQLVWTATPEGVVDYYNQRYREFSGIQTARRWRWAPIIHPEDLRSTVEAWRKAVRSGEMYEIEHRVKRADGSFNWYLSRGVPVFDDQGKIIHWYGTATDIHAYKCAEEELLKAKEIAEAANRAKSEFLANMSHEIRTPMTVFMAAVDHLLQIDQNPEHRQLLAMADQSAQQLLALIDDILDLSRIEARRVEIEEIEFDPRSCVRKIIDMLKLQAQEKNLHLEFEFAANLPTRITSDSDRLEQILTNLISNAIKFTHEGSVRVTVAVRQNMLEFAVRDTGIGIPEEKRDRLFQNFSQIDSSFKRRYGGTGLGLAICKGLVELMGGEISVQSREGYGSTFSFTLPPEKAREDLSSTNLVKKDDTSSGIRILLAEDDTMVRDILQLTLERRGRRTEIAENGQEAVRKWKEGKFDLILMDLQMPEMTGLEATRKIRELEAGEEKHTTIIGLTAHARPEVKEECLTAGMDQVLTKPVKIKELEEVIGSWLPKDCKQG